MASSYYSKLFSADVGLGGEFLKGQFPDLVDNLRQNLEAEYSTEETKRALSQMGSFKAPGPDGYQPVFFKRTWELTGTAVHAFVEGKLKGEEVKEDEGEALLVLVPKEQKPCSIKKNFGQLVSATLA